MTTVDDVLAVQTTDNVLTAPTVTTNTKGLKSDAVADTTTLTVSLYNSTTSNTVYAYITGLAINNNNAVFLLESNGSTPYYPANPSSVGTALSANCAIPLGAPGTTVNVTIPYIAGGRIWFCTGNTLTFLLNPGINGPGLVEPSVSNTADPNYNLTWDFCEFTYNSSQLYANISYVDFVCLPVALTVTSTSGATQHVGGLPSNGLDNICNGLIAQNAKDGAGWDQLIVTNNGANLRALSPTNGIIFNNSLFENYWTNYIDSVWDYYVSNTIVVDTQASWGQVTGNTSNDRTSLAFSGLGSFTKPAAADIFGASSGAFAAQTTNTDALLNIGARLDAAFNRSTLLTNSSQPDKELVSSYYTNSVTNHYARIVHAANVDGKGYCFPYDDVTPTGGADQSGFVSDGSPQNFLVTLGGGNAFARRMERSIEAKPKFARRSVQWSEDVKERISQSTNEDTNRDLEKGDIHPKLLQEMSQQDTTPRILLPAPLGRLFGKYLTKFYASPLYTNHVLPIFSLLSQVIASFLSLSMRAVLSRIFIIVFVLLFYLFDIAPQGAELETQRRILESAGLMRGNGTMAFQSS
ncbi:hypothetical protein D0Z07_8556 [Hyphodiscus hymeniophilus]|uniref:GH64 domain-containing protein n=1 Tax=Hyphodiscus hymeniophilus TaxID=353542 RepID=A0A9P6SN08_9HELO|nr:hypothetical protein D0Z07_8556 [Hyphodiscus hymeniophilus]